MQCVKRRMDCTGPYTEKACPDCEATEGKCLRSKPKPGCGGPFKDPCALCKNADTAGCNTDLNDLKKTRPLIRNWMTTLKLNTVNKVDKYYPKTSPLSPAQIDQKLNQSQVDFCPWVQIGNLFTTVTTGNDAGWKDLVTELAKSPGCT